MLADAVKARLTARAVADRISDAAEFAALLDSNALPAAGTSAFVVPLGLRGGPDQGGSGLFVQQVEESVGVFLALREVNPAGGRARQLLPTLIEATVTAIAGWQAPGAIGVFRLTRGSVLSFAKNVLIYQIDFAATSQLRIAP